MCELKIIKCDLDFDAFENIALIVCESCFKDGKDCYLEVGDCYSKVGDCSLQD